MSVTVEQKAFFDREYNTRIPAAGFDWMTAYRERSDAAFQAVERVPDLVYDEASGSKLDIYPAGPGTPLFVWIHGGYWRASSKNDNAFVAPGLVGQGVSVASIDYTLAPAVRIGEIVRQVRTAIAWLATNAGRWGVDTRRIHVGGHSAGGQLTGMVASRDWQADFGLAPDIIDVALGISGLYELEPLRHTFVNDAMQFDDAEIAANSPVRLIPSNSRTRLLLTVGGKESSEFHRQTETYGEAWTAAGNSVEYIGQPDFHHFDIILELERPGAMLFDQLLSAIKA